MNQKGIIPLVIAIIVVVLLIGVGSFYYWQKQQSASLSVPTSSPTAHQIPQKTVGPNTYRMLLNSPSPASSSTVATGNWKTYSNAKYGYTLQYPPDYNVTVSNSAAVTFRNTSQQQNLFIIYVLPSNNLSTDQFVNAMNIDKNSTIEHLTENNISWTWFKLIGSEGSQSNPTYLTTVNYITTHNGYGFEVGFTINGEGLQPQYSSVVKQVVAAFKFTN